jgi:hypothetical protein
MKVSEIDGRLGIDPRRIDKYKWVRLEEFPERNQMQPRPGMSESFREYLRERWEEAATMAASYWKGSGNSAMPAAIRGCPSCSRRDANRKQ